MAMRCVMVMARSVKASTATVSRYMYRESNTQVPIGRRTAPSPVILARCSLTHALASDRQRLPVHGKMYAHWQTRDLGNLFDI